MKVIAQSFTTRQADQHQQLAGYSMDEMLQGHAPCSSYQFKCKLPTTISVHSRDIIVYKTVVYKTIASLASATAPSFSGMSCLTWVPAAALCRRSDKKIDFCLEHVLNLISKAKKVVNVHNILSQSSCTNRAENTVIFLC